MVILYELLCLLIFTLAPCYIAVKDVIIIGGGLSGLAAARKIFNEAPTEYRIDILEARLARYGGRIWTDRIKYPKALGLDADIGGIWFPQDGRLQELVSRYNITVHKPSKVQLYDLDEAKVYNDNEVIELFNKLYKGVVAALSQFAGTEKDDELWPVLTRQFNKKFDEFTMKALFKVLPVTASGERSAAMFSPQSILGKSVLLSEGTDEIVNRLASGGKGELPLEIQLNTEVRQIKVDNVTNKVKVRTTTAEQHTADIVIVALPLEILKDGSVLFEPQLPRPYQEAMSKLGFGNYNRMVLSFDKVFWPEDVERFIALRKFDNDIGFLPVWINGYAFLKKPFLVGDISGEMADKFEEMSDKDVIQQALSILSGMFGEEKVHTATVTSLKRSSWGSDIFSSGAYSYPKVGCKDEDFDILSKPFCPHIFFAGEYTDRIFTGSLEAAYLSGIRAAENVLSGYCDKTQTNQKFQGKDQNDEL